MEHPDELIAARALYALDPAGEAELDRHLETCERCRNQLRELTAVAATLAFATPPAAAPAALRDRVLAAVDAHGAPVAATAPIQQRRPAAASAWRLRWPLVVTPALAAAVLGLLAWNLSLRGGSDLAGQLAAGQAVTLRGVGTVVAAPGGRMTLYTKIGRPPAGRTYEAWVIGGGTARPAGLFAGGGVEQVALTRTALAGDTIAVTVEPAGGTAAPTTAPIAAARLT